MTVAFRAFAPVRVLNNLDAPHRAGSRPSVFSDHAHPPIHFGNLTSGQAKPVDSSLDPITLERLTTTTGVDVPACQAATAAPMILARHEAEWVNLRCAVVSEIVERAAGQDVKPLGGLVDRVAPMTYHRHGPPPPDLDRGRLPRDLCSGGISGRRDVAGKCRPRICRPARLGTAVPSRGVRRDHRRRVRRRRRWCIAFPARPLTSDRLAEIARRAS